MNLGTRYLGLNLRNPVVASAGPCHRPWTGSARWRRPVWVRW